MASQGFATSLDFTQEVRQRSLLSSIVPKPVMCWKCLPNSSPRGKVTVCLSCRFLWRHDSHHGQCQAPCVRTVEVELGRDARTGSHKQVQRPQHIMASSPEPKWLQSSLIPLAQGSIPESLREGPLLHSPPTSSPSPSHSQPSSGYFGSPRG